MIGGSKAGLGGGGVEGLEVPAAHQLAGRLPGNRREMCLIKTQFIDEPRDSCDA